MQKYNGMEIAVVGMSCQFPGANDVLEFWQNLKGGKESIKRFSKEELLAAGVPKDVIDNPKYVAARGELSGAEYFDSEFFGYRAAEAKLMDPQLRLFYQHCWKAIEDAAYDLNDYQDKIGLFAGGGPNNNWENASILSNTEGEVEEVTASQLRNISYLSTRVSYKLDLKGPSLYINTTCSTSLVAIQRACMSLLLRECKMSLSGGAFITNYPDRGYHYQEGMIYSADGHCRAFDHNASGTVAGEGVGVLLLKRLDDAIKDGDTIHAVIKGSGINNDGAQKVSYTAPSTEGQQEAIMKALKMAKVPKESVSYIETHGTGTGLGDVIEIDALNRVYGESKTPYCAIGSVKTNIGHLVTASGVAGIIKTILALKHGEIPPSLNFEKPNPKINFKNSPFYVNDSFKKWERGQHPLRAGVSSFGIGGTNVHMILEEAPVREDQAQVPSRNLQLLQFSAKSESALDAGMTSFKNYLLQYPETSLADAAYTLQVGRSEFSYRKTLVVDSIREAITKLRIPADLKTTKSSKSDKKLAFMFTGQGSQYQNMGMQLMQEKIFREHATQCFELAKKLTGKDFYEILQSSPEEVNQTVNSQPLLFIIQYSLTKQLMHWGYKPDVLIGHSIGEYAAACISGILELKDALKLVAVRGQLMQEQEKGQMLSVALGREELKNWIAGRKDISLAASNSSAHSVVSGSDDAIEQLRVQFEENGIHSRLLHTSHAFHSYMMKPVLESFQKSLEEVSFHNHSIPIISTMTGKPVNGEMQQAEYWKDQIVNEVKFSGALESLLAENSLACIEIGPGDTLSTFVRSHHLKADDHQVFSTISKPDQIADDNRFLLQTVGKLWSTGLRPDYDNFYEDEKRNRTNLPTYAFDKVKYPLYVDSYKMISDLIVKGGGASENPAEWTHKLTWEVEAKNSESIVANRPVIVFSRDSQLETGEDIYSVKPGTQYQRIGDKSFEIDATNPVHFVQLFEELGLEDVRIVYALNDENKKDTKSKVDVCYYGLLNLVRALGGRSSSSIIDLLMITFDGHKVLPDDNINPFQSLATGVAKVVNKEYANIGVMQLDFHTDDPDWLSTALSEPISAGEIAAYRKGIRFTHGVKSITLRPKGGIPTFKDHGVYLITGGAGGIGLALAQQMAEEINDAHFILIGRSQLPDREQWAQSNHETIKRISEVENAGGHVHYLAMDVADKKAYPTLKKTIKEIGQLNGIIHAAGTIDRGGIIQTRDMDTDNSLLATKVYGALNLLEEIVHDQLDFFINCSSAAAFKAPVGEVAYVSVNLFLDALSYKYPFIKSIGWNAWAESGMAVKAGNGLVGANSVSNKEGYTLFKNILKSHESHVIISRNTLTSDQQLEEELISDAEEIDNLKENINQSLSVEDRLTSLWEKFFGKEGIKPLDDFFELGGDSLKALTMINWIKKEFSVDVLITEFFKTSSLRQLGEFIEDALGSARENIIPKAKLAAKYPVSAAQNRLYFLWNYDKGSLGYNLPQFVKVEGDVDKDRLSKAFSDLVDRHEILRTSFVHEGDQVYQKVNNINFAVEFAEIAEHELDTYFENFCTPFDLTKAPLLRVKLLKVDTGLHYLLVDIHHIATDGISQGILLQEFAALYADESLEKPSIQYKDFAVWQKEQTTAKSWIEQKSFWMSQYDGELPVLDLPADYKRPVDKQKPGGKVSFEFESHLQKRIAAFNEDQHVTSFMFLFSAYNLLLGKLARTTDVVVGTPTAGRPHHDVEGLVGMFVNTLPIRSRFDHEMTFKEFVQNVKQVSLQAFENQQYPFEELLNDLKVRRESNRHPLFDVMFSLQNFGGAAIEIPGLALKRQERKLGHNKFDLSLTGYEGKDKLLFNIEYSGDLFDEATIQRYAKGFQQIIKQVADNPDILIGDISLVDEYEYKRVVNDFNQTEKLYPENITILDLFEKQVAETPNANAVHHEDRVLTYRELNGRANTLALLLSEKYVIKSGDIIPVVMSRGIDFLISVIAIWKLKAAPAPLSIYWPEARIKNAIDKLNAPVSLVNNVGIDESGLAIGEEFHIVEAHLLQETTANFTDKPNPKLPIYVFHTSGTTGMPKAVVVPHEGVYNRLMWMNDHFGKASAQSVLRTTKHIFDSAIWQLLWPLINGGQTVIPSEERVFDLKYFSDLIEEYGITMTDLVPSLFNEMVRQMRMGKASFDPFDLRDIVIGGEAITAETTNFFIQKYPGIKITNLYGPTEASIGCVYYPVEGEKEIIPIGTPISNTKIYILDQNKQVVPVGVPGEMYISGVCLAIGYFGDKMITDAKFVPNILDAQPGKMYKTGDLAKWLPDGNISFLGRIDDQVKIRGYRIELGEIESILNKLNGVSESVVVVHDNDHGNKILVAYLAASELYDETKAKEYLKSQLPNYMIPSKLIMVDKLPVSASGKVDKAKLPKPDFRQERKAPANDVENKLVHIWSDLLGISNEELSVDANFFEMGGHSLMAIRVVSAVKEVFDVPLTVKSIFDHPTIEELAGYIDVFAAKEEEDEDEYESFEI
ncbi:non-ribosomal peptide synthetase/type I polyketide synthase [Fulvivirga sediminis]|uniref:Amino acid adenylation domain-containing protein n=1 Tax=Fulvivirga sediminis TaxID=2803949 RepID=A0A937K3A1_9BACT|nr:non-ribosomal peptide synthetase/type I polyketide synthase [Fulvivirga sediminis]MBL3658752.1 amino acid adenylation domain-containing protein [Fulvivirga sediminis]